ncbi:hypothetical protein CVT24_006350 [Panaeolus cyanescens]|uniref:F-box domain-containing protein n=1 Tax=Panaeolus cyanescens TaxID=181874 RepID=A0A409YE92_9AGAR|nr:hypothetical protein CVT24_006350 [Panaeolus cyanescens]
MAKVTLPYELWLYIAWFLPLETLFQICDLHPAFYEVSVRPYQGRLELTKRDKWTKKLMKCLNIFSGFNHCFKSVAIQPWLIEAQLKPAQRRRDKLRTTVCRLVNHEYLIKKAQLRLQKRIRKDISRLTNAFKNMPNVEEYEICWDGSPKYHLEFYKAFSFPILKTWAARLTRLSLTLPPQFLKDLPRLRLPRLIALAYYFPTDSRPWREISYDHEGFMVFVHNLQDSLQNLTLVSTCNSGNLELDKFLDELGYFPKLRSITFSIPRDGSHLPDTTSLCRFLQRHSATLTNVTLAASPSLTNLSPDAGSPEWISSVLGAHVRLPHLQSLKMTLTPLDNPPLSQIARVLQMQAENLVTLGLDEHPISLSEFDIIFRPSSFGNIVFPKLGHLILYLHSFTPELFCAIVEQMPALKRLDIICSDSSLGSADVWADRISNSIQHSHLTLRDLETWSRGTKMSVTPAHYGLGQVLDSAFHALGLDIPLIAYKDWPAVQRLLSQ